MELSENELPRKLMITIAPINIWLVVSNPLKNMKVSWDYYSLYMYIYIYIWKVIKNHVPNHQPDIYHPGYTRSVPAVPISGKFRITLQDHHRLQATQNAATRRMKSMDYPLVNQQFANLNMAIEIVDLPIKNGDFPYFYP